MLGPNRFVMCIPMSFETGEQTTHKVYFPAKAKILRMRTHVTKALAASDAGTITMNNSASAAMASGQVSLPLSTLINNNASCVPTTNNTVTADDYIELVSAKTTAGGKVNVFIEYKLVR